MQSVDILGYSISAQGLDADAEHALRIIMSNEATHHVACANPHSFVVAAKDKEFQYALAHSDLLLPDGAGIAYTSEASGWHHLWIVDTAGTKRQLTSGEWEVRGVSLARDDSRRPRRA